MHILPFILGTIKIIALVLLAILTIAVLLLVIFLFVPFRYSVDLENRPESPDAPVNLRAFVKVGWLSNIFRFGYTYEDDKSNSSLSILFFSVGKNKERNVKRRYARKIKKSARATQRGLGVYSFKRKKKPPPDKPDSDDSVVGRLAAFVATISYVLQYPDRDPIVRQTMLFLKRFFKALKPKIFKLSGRIGFDTPDITGYALGCIYIVRSFCGLNMEITGDFENPVIALRLEMEGALSLWRLMLPIARYIASKPIWKIVKIIFFGKDDIDEQ